METNISEEKRLIKAKKRVEEIKSFYQHLTIYLLVNLFLTFATSYFDFTIKIFDGLELGSDATGSIFVRYPVWIIWGVILLVDAIRVFVFPKAIGSEWQDRKIKEFMNEKNTHE